MIKLSPENGIKIKVESIVFGVLRDLHGKTWSRRPDRALRCECW
jgi:hypothetical protein